jgi:DNA polymerase-1
MSGLLDHVQVHLVENADDAGEAARWLSTRESVALDTETTGLNLRHDRVRLLQLGDPDQAWVFPLDHPRSWGGLALSLLDRYTGRVICHHLKFDYAMLNRDLSLHIDPTRLEDTMLMARVLEPTRSAALKRLSASMVDSRAAVMDRELANAMNLSGYGWDTVPINFQTYWFYAGVDAILTHRIHDIMVEKLAADQTTAYQLELAAALVCSRMERHGVKIDTQLATKYYGELQQYVEAVARWCVSNYGVSPGSNADVVKVLVEAGHTFIKLTKGGAVCLDKEVLSEVDHPLAHEVLRRRQAQKIASTYLRHFIEDVDDEMRLYPSINTCEAKTSRMSMSGPNFQQLPRASDDNPLSKIVRQCVVPGDGHTLLLCDFDQIEWRLFASLANDPDLQAAFGGDDFFTVICRNVFHDPGIRKSDPRRQTTKNAMYARIYGAGTAKFAWTAGITFDEAEMFTALLDQSYPAIRRLQMGIDAQARQGLTSTGTAYVRSPLTNRRFVIDDDATYKLVNYLFQGTAAEILKMKLIQLEQAGLGDFLVLPVHDEVILEVPDDQLTDVARTVYETMNDASLFAVPLTASCAVGARWGDKQEYTVA